jgi:DNA-binding NarL/FixJ family response regulator
MSELRPNALREPEPHPPAVDPESHPSRFVRVLVADDHAVVPTGCRARLEVEPHVVVVGETSRMADLAVLAHRMVPRVIVIATEPGPTTIDLVRATCQASAASDVVVVSTRADDVYVRRTLTAGARAYVGHDDPALGRAVRAVAAGGAYFSPEVATVLRDGFLRGGGIAIDRLLHRFSDVDRVVLYGLLDGLSNDELAARLELPADTVQRSRDRVVALLASADGEIAAPHIA